MNLRTKLFVPLEISKNKILNHDLGRVLPVFWEIHLFCDSSQILGISNASAVSTVLSEKKCGTSAAASFLTQYFVLKKDLGVKNYENA